MRFYNREIDSICIDLIDMGIIPSIADNYLIVKYETNEVASNEVLGLIERHIGGFKTSALSIEEDGCSETIKIKIDWINNSIPSQEVFKTIISKLAKEKSAHYELEDMHVEDQFSSSFYTPVRHYEPGKGFSPASAISGFPAFTLEVCNKICEEINLILDNTAHYTPCQGQVYYHPCTFIKGRGFIPLEASVTFEKAAYPAYKSEAECQCVCDKLNAVLDSTK